MHVSPPENPVEDRLIEQLDRGIPLGQREDEMAILRESMKARERKRLAEIMLNDEKPL